MATLLELESNLGSTLTLIDGETDTGYYLLDAVDWGVPRWERQTSGPRGMLGAVTASQVAGNRIVTLPIRLSGSGSGAIMAQRANELGRVLDEIRRAGGSLTWRAPNMPTGARMHFAVLDAEGSIAEWGRSADVLALTTFVATLTCAPLAEGDPLEWIDDLSDDPFTSGRAGRMHDSALLPAGWSHNGAWLAPTIALPDPIAFTYLPVMRSVRVVTKIRLGATWAASSIYSVPIRIVQAGAQTSWIELRLFGSSPAAMQIRFYLVTNNGGTATALGSAIAGGAITAGADYWLEARVNGQRFVGLLWDREPGRYASSGWVMSNVMLPAIAEDMQAYEGITGLCGSNLNVQNLIARIDAFEVGPYHEEVTFPHVALLEAGMPGSYGPKFALDLRLPATVIATMRAGWWRRPLLWNRVWHGDAGNHIFEDLGAPHLTAGWDIVGGASTMATNGATSIARVLTTVGFGRAAFEVVTKALVDSGARFHLPGHYRFGRAYLAWAWAWAPSSTTQMRLRVGNTTASVNSANAALATTRKLWSAILRPTTDLSNIDVALTTAAATITTVRQDGIGVVETIATCLEAAISSTSATTMTVRETPNGLPPTPFVAIVGVGLATNEQVLVTDVDDATDVWTIVRGWDGSTAATHAIDETIALLPEFEAHRHGIGGYPPFGIIEAEHAYYTAGDPTTFARASNANALSGFALEISPGIDATGGTAVANYLLEPSLVPADDLTQGRELAVEVYARVFYDSALLTGFRMSMWAANEEAGHAVMPSEFGAAGFQLPATVGGVWRPVFLGTLRLAVDPAQPTRYRFIVSAQWETSGSGSVYRLDQIILLPARQRIASQEGQTYDEAHGLGINDWPGEIARRFEADLTGRLKFLDRGYSPHNWAAATGIAGSTLELPPSDRGWELLVHLSSLYVGNPEVDASTEAAATVQGDYHVAPVPRYALIREE